MSNKGNYQRDKICIHLFTCCQTLAYFHFFKRCRNIPQTLNCVAINPSSIGMNDFNPKQVFFCFFRKLFLFCFNPRVASFSGMHEFLSGFRKKCKFVKTTSSYCCIEIFLFKKRL